VHVDAIREPLAEALTDIEPQPSPVAFFSTVTGELMDTSGLNAEYWYQSIRRTVQFEQAVRSAHDAGYQVFIESSPHPVLIAGIEQTLAECNPDVIVVPSLGRDDGGLQRFWLSVGQAHITGVAVDWRAAFADLGTERVDLPTYAFQRQRFWLPVLGVGGGDLAGLGLAGAEHGLLGAVLQRPDSGGVVLTGRLSMATHPWLADHVVDGVVLFPGAGFVELVLRAGDEVGCSVVEELTLLAPLVLPPVGGVQVQVVVDALDELGSREVRVYSRGAGTNSSWVWHAQGALRAGVSEPAVDLSVWPPVGASVVDAGDVYEVLAGRGYAYGPAFRGLRALWRRGREVFAEVTVGEGVTVGGFGIHPAVLDAALHGWGVAEGGDATMLPFSWRGVCLHAAGGGCACCGGVACAGAGSTGRNWGGVGGAG
jgi:acyl transferase domain-containing protein